MRVLMAISFAFAAVVGACSVANPNHCANLEGDATCKALDVDTPYCSKCVADNNGCVAEALDAACEAGSTSVATTTSSPTTSTTGATTTGSTSTSDPTTSPATTTTTTSTVTTDPSTSTTTTTGDTSTTTTTGDTSTTTTGDTTDSSTGGSTDTTGTTDATTDETTMGGPMCGDDMQENPEICDGTDLNDLNCVSKNPTKYSGGTLKCAMDCSAYDETMCCLSQDQTCQPNMGQKCCPGTTCKLTLGLYKCKP
jgi:hypothetical protein